MTIYSQIGANKTRTYLIFVLFIVLVTGFFFAVGAVTGGGRSYFVVGLIFSLVASVGSYYFSDKLVLLSVGARPADPKLHYDLYTVTENLCIAAGMPKPKIYVMNDPAPNAFATGRDPNHAVVCATTGLLSMMERSELEGVIAHELSHIRNYDMLVMTVVAVLVGTLSFASEWIMRSLFWGGSRNRDEDNRGSGGAIVMILSLIVIVLAPLFGSLIQLAISRRREYLADASGALLTRYPEGLARALEKIASYGRPMRSASTATAHLFIANPFGKSTRREWLQNLFSTHPPVSERIQILRQM